MTSIRLELEDDLLALLHQLNQPVDRTVRQLLVLDLYRRGMLSSGKAAELLGMTRREFVSYASHRGIPYFEMTEDGWEGERLRSANL
jgi:predicted HTH domain antitoxin